MGIVAVSEPPMLRDPWTHYPRSCMLPHIIEPARDKEPIKVKAY
jgi:hypothetical protein